MSSDQVLDVERHPTIVFQSTSVVIKAQETHGMDLTVSGQLTLHKVTRLLTVPVAARVDAGALTARGSFSLNQTDYGIKPVSVGGVVSVKDKLTVSFAIVAKPSGG
jgi:polyisoprenoid-binding protein YceI